MEYIEYVNKGIRTFLPIYAGFISRELIRLNKDQWWEDVLDALSDQYHLPEDGTYDELMSYLDISNCCRLIDRRWRDVFKYVLSENCKTYARELMGVRNAISHRGVTDMDQHFAERALDTMILLCKEIDNEAVDELQVLYDEVRSKADNRSSSGNGLAQPETDSIRGELKEGNLLNLVGSGNVQKTQLSRKVSYGGKTNVYPVYKISLNDLFYNDQNDRIATWISQYETENGKDSLNGLNKDIYNQIIENFIVESNPDSIQKTQKNISIVGQREPGVALSDGRIVDGNRRFTCLRRLQRTSAEPLFFETVILDLDIEQDKKQIKLLELAIQHGEEKKVDYDLIDYAIGTYRDIVQTKLITLEEYAASTNEPLSEVKKRIEVANIITEFLEYVKLPEQYYVARDLEIYSLFQEMLPLLKKLEPDEQEQLKRITFNNALLGAIPDQRKFIRDIKKLVQNGLYKPYFEDQKPINDSISSILESQTIHTQDDLNQVISLCEDEAQQMSTAMERALLRARNQQIKSKPSENLNKCLDLLMDIDPRLFVKLSEDERKELSSNFNEIERIIDQFKKQL